MHHSINTRDTPSKNLATYPQSIAKVEVLKDQLELLFKLRLIHTSSSPWGFPVVLAKKLDKGVQFCMDYQTLNKYTKRDRYPLSHISELLNMIGHKHYLSKINLLLGYW